MVVAMSLIIILSATDFIWLATLAAATAPVANRMSGAGLPAATLRLPHNRDHILRSAKAVHGVLSICCYAKHRVRHLLKHARLA